jgi:HAE1 family hydrophobic/amphiphilic exporter-1
MWCLYYSWTLPHFGRIAEKYKLVKHEEENPLTEEIDNNEVHK